MRIAAAGAEGGLPCRAAPAGLDPNTDPNTDPDPDPDPDPCGCGIGLVPPIRFPSQGNGEAARGGCLWGGPLLLATGPREETEETEGP